MTSCGNEEYLRKEPATNFPISFRLQKVRPVKVLGVLMMIDEGEADWKVITIDAEDKWAPFINDIDDVEKEMPGMLDAIREWYRTYKIPDGKPPNTFGLGEKFMDKTYAKSVIDECHHAWKELLSGEKHRKVEGEDEEVKKLVRKLALQVSECQVEVTGKGQFKEEFGT